jgi:OPT family oligopeptide transporter
MREYEPVPSWWYSVVFLVLFALSIVCVQVFDTDLPVWALIIAILVPVIYFLPAAFIYASTSQIMTLNLIAQLVPGFAIAGRPVAVMVSTSMDVKAWLMVKISKTLSLQVLSQAMTFVQDMKLGHYMKLPPRSVFFAQLIGTVITCLIQVGTKTLLFDNVPGICGDDRTDGLTCDVTKTFFTSTVVWFVCPP